MRIVGPPPTIPLPTPIMDPYPLLTSSGLAGKINSGLSFSAKYVTMGTPSTLEFNNTSFSLVSWFNSTSTAHSRFVSSGLYNYAAGFEFGLNTISTGGVGGNLGANGTAANVVSFGTTTTFNDGNWHQAVMVVDQTAKTAQIYVDGVAQSLTNANCGTVSGTTKNFSSCSPGQYLQHHGTIHAGSLQV